LVRHAAAPLGEQRYAWTARVGSVPPAAVEWADAVVSLSGAPLAALPWTKARRREIMDSRVDATSAIARAVLEATRPPDVWVSASACGFYGTDPPIAPLAGPANPVPGAARPAGRPAADAPPPGALRADAAAEGTEARAPAGALTEDSASGTGFLAGVVRATEVQAPPRQPPPPAGFLTEDSASGTGFLAGVVRAWEAAALPAAARTRVVRARTGLVLGPPEGGGLMAGLVAATRFGMGPKLGSGAQYWPWISLRDEVRALDFALRTESLAGPVNLAGPRLATADQITGALARAVRRPSWLRLPAPLLTAAMGEAARELILASQPVFPQALADAGFKFLDPTAASALAWCLQSHP
jgi:NAD dependent epimerase/dehydratase family enzyme